MTQRVKEDDYRLGKNDGDTGRPVKPVIAGGIDIPFPATDSYNKIRELKAQQHDYDIDNLKHKFAIRLVYICLSTAAVLTVIDVFVHPESAIFSATYELSKLIGTTALGFLFGVRKM